MGRPYANSADEAPEKIPVFRRNSLTLQISLTFGSHDGIACNSNNRSNAMMSLTLTFAITGLVTLGFLSTVMLRSRDTTE